MIEKINTTNFQGLLDEETVVFNKKLDFELAKLLLDQKLSLSVAESVTGGMISARITSLAGSSKYFLGGVVSYHNKVKVNLLRVAPGTIRENGAVSEAVALEMARGVKKLTQSDIGVATTGIAGPANQEYSEADTGQVFIAFLILEKEFIKHFKFTGSREIIRRKTVNATLGYLRQYLQNEMDKVASN